MASPIPGCARICGHTAAVSRFGRIRRCLDGPKRVQGLAYVDRRYFRCRQPSLLCQCIQIVDITQAPFRIFHAQRCIELRIAWRRVSTTAFKGAISKQMAAVFQQPCGSGDEIA